MIDTEFYILKSGKKKEFFNNVLSGYHNQRENIVCFNPGQPETEEDKYIKQYQILNTTVFINYYDGSENPAAAITAWGETKEDLKEKVRTAKTLLEKLGGEKLIEKDILSGK
jgi:hypothetical protein